MRDILKSVVVLTLVSLFAGLILCIVNEKTTKFRTEQDRLARLEAIDAVLPDYDNRPDEEKVELEGTTFYIARKDGQIIGVAFEEEAEGYGGTIKVMIGLNPAGEVLGIDIVKHLETPGLGTKIDDPQEENPFKNQFFKEKRKNQGKPPLTLRSKIAVIKDGGEIEAITGATISPRAVCEAVRKGLELFERVKEEVLR